MSFARNLGGPAGACGIVTGRPRKVINRNLSMHANRKSDKGIVSKKPSNECTKQEEKVEKRPLTKRNTVQSAMCRTQSRGNVSSGLDGVRQRAIQDRSLQFTALLHHVTQTTLRQGYEALKPNAAPGIDGVTWRDYGKNLTQNIMQLHQKLHSMVDHTRFFLLQQQVFNFF